MNSFSTEPAGVKRRATEGKAADIGHHHEENDAAVNTAVAIPHG